MLAGTNPVEAGIVASLAEPGGNTTGFTAHAGSEIEAKRMQLLKEAIPGLERVAVLALSSDWVGPEGEAVRGIAAKLGVTLVHAEHTPTSYADAFAQIVRNRPHALFVSRQPASYANRQLIADFALDQELPSTYHAREFVAAGGLMSYGVSLTEVYRRAAEQVARILAGAKPADLAVQRPTKFEMALNLKTAKSLGLRIPPLVLAQADEVFE